MDSQRTGVTLLTRGKRERHLTESREFNAFFRLRLEPGVACVIAGEPFARSHLLRNEGRADDGRSRSAQATHNDDPLKRT